MTNTKIADANGVGRKDVYTKVTERKLLFCRRIQWACERASREEKPTRNRVVIASQFNRLLFRWRLVTRLLGLGLSVSPPLRR
jgi:hypothetical protein